MICFELIKKNFLFIFLVALGLHWCMRASSSCGEWGLLFTVVREILSGGTGSRCPGFGNCSFSRSSTWVSVVPTLGLRTCGSWALELTGSVAVLHALSCSAARGIFLDRGWSLGPLHWQADLYPLYRQESLIFRVCFFFLYDVWDSSKLIFLVCAPAPIVEKAQFPFLHWIAFVYL